MLDMVYLSIMRGWTRAYFGLLSCWETGTAFSDGAVAFVKAEEMLLEAVSNTGQFRAHSFVYGIADARETRAGVLWKETGHSTRDYVQYEYIMDR